MKVPEAKLVEDDNHFVILDDKGIRYLTVYKKDRCVTMNYPLNGAITPDGMRGIYVAERENSIELFLHFVSSGDTDRLWCIGELSKDKEELKNARDWTRRVNSMYRE